MDEFPHIDKKTLESIRKLMSAKYDRFIQEYFDSTDLSIRKAEEAIAIRDAAVIASAAHMIKSSSASIGLLRVARIAEGIERAADSVSREGGGDWVMIAGSLEALREAFDTARDIMKREPGA